MNIWTVRLQVGRVSSLQVVSQKLNICVQNKLYVHIYQPLHEVYTVSLLSSCGNILNSNQRALKVFIGAVLGLSGASSPVLPTSSHLLTTSSWLWSRAAFSAAARQDTPHPVRDRKELCSYCSPRHKICAPETFRKTCYCVTSHTVLVRLKQIHRNVD